MKRLWTLLALTPGFAGCVTPPLSTQVAPIRPATVAAAPIRAEDITPENARQVSQALADELDREAQQELTAPTSANR